MKRRHHRRIVGPRQSTPRRRMTRRQRAAWEREMCAQGFYRHRLQGLLTTIIDAETDDLDDRARAAAYRLTRAPSGTI